MRSRPNSRHRFDLVSKSRADAKLCYELLKSAPVVKRRALALDLLGISIGSDLEVRRVSIAAEKVILHVRPPTAVRDGANVEDLAEDEWGGEDWDRESGKTILIDEDGTRTIID